MNIFNFISPSETEKILTEKQKIACDAIQNSDYFIKELPTDFYINPLGVFAITPGDSQEIFNLFFFAVISNSKEQLKLIIKVNENGEYKLNDETNNDLNILLQSLNIKYIAIPLKLIYDFKDFYQNDTTQNIIKKLQDIKKLSDTKILNNKEKIKLPFVIHSSLVNFNFLILSYYKIFEELSYIDHIYLEYKFGVGLIYSNKILRTIDDVKKIIFTQKNLDYLSIAKLEDEINKENKINSIEIIPENPLKKSEPQILKGSDITFKLLKKIKSNKKYYWKKKNHKDINRFLKDKRIEGSFLFYEKRDGTSILAYLKDNEVHHQDVSVPFEQIKDLGEAIPFTEENFNYFLELKDNRLYTPNEAWKSLRREMEDAQKFQREEIDNSHFNLQICAKDLCEINSSISSYAKDFLGIKTGIACSIGLRNTMEDEHFAKAISFSVKDKNYNAALFGVFDGHGSDACAKYISKHIEESLIEHLKNFNKSQLT